LEKKNREAGSMTDDRRDCGFGKGESRRISGSKPKIEQPANQPE
jgi:hypothetical protein